MGETTIVILYFFFLHYKKSLSPRHGLFLFSISIYIRNLNPIVTVCSLFIIYIASLRWTLFMVSAFGDLSGSTIFITLIIQSSENFKLWLQNARKILRNLYFARVRCRLSIHFIECEMYGLMYIIGMYSI